MYLPEPFRMDERSVLLSFAAACPFATVITPGAGAETPCVSHLPLLVDGAGGKLRGHLARENSQTADFARGAAAVAVFHGPHAYVSPSVYTEHPSVPTWNYVVVHVRGRSRLVDDAGLSRILDDMVARFDDSAWELDPDESFRRKMFGAIAGFEVDIESIEGKWKLSQNRPPADQERVAEWLERGDASARAVAQMMRSLRAGRQDAG